MKAMYEQKKTASGKAVFFHNTIGLGTTIAIHRELSTRLILSACVCVCNDVFSQFVNDTLICKFNRKSRLFDFSQKIQGIRHDFGHPTSSHRSQTVSSDVRVVKK